MVDTKLLLLVDAHVFLFYGTFPVLHPTNRECVQESCHAGVLDISLFLIFHQSKCYKMRGGKIYHYSLSFLG
jgi:hypothetical protein